MKCNGSMCALLSCSRNLLLETLSLLGPDWMVSGLARLEDRVERPSARVDLPPLSPLILVFNAGVFSLGQLGDSQNGGVILQGMNFVAGALLLACSVRDPSINLPPPNPVQNRWSSHGEINGVNSGSLGRGSDARSPSADSHVMSVTTESSYCSDEDEEVVVVLRGEGQDEEVGTEADGVGDTEPEDETPKEWRSGPQHQKAEEDVFWLMLALSTRLSGVGAGLGMRELWLPGVPQLKVLRWHVARSGLVMRPPEGLERIMDITAHHIY